MPDLPIRAIYLAASAKRDLAAIIRWSIGKFGYDAALRYQALIEQALLDIAKSPDRPGSFSRPELLVDGARTFHLEFSRKRVDGPQVNQPRHFLLYRYGELRVDVARILHDSQDLPRHLPKGYKANAD